MARTSATVPSNVIDPLGLKYAARTTLSSGCWGASGPGSRTGAAARVDSDSGLTRRRTGVESSTPICAEIARTRAGGVRHAACNSRAPSSTRSEGSKPRCPSSLQQAWYSLALDARRTQNATFRRARRQMLTCSAPGASLTARSSSGCSSNAVSKCWTSDSRLGLQCAKAIELDKPLGLPESKPSSGGTRCGRNGGMGGSASMALASPTPVPTTISATLLTAFLLECQAAPVISARTMPAVTFARLSPSLPG
mmetsp:Transcript_123203/g.359736  ORF Transcript_123203/g.359736 Transcript_123203/m.359736 type:complete len:252 (+) Transcript_123203:816-1571(+)